MSDLQRQVFAKKGLPPIIESNQNTIAEENVSSASISHHLLRRRAMDYSPLQWDTFFDSKKSIKIGDDTFCVYLKGDSGPIFYLLHGGGYSGLTWACFTEILCKEVNCRVIAPDLRGHGETCCADEKDLSIERQVEDVVKIHEQIVGDNKEIPTILVGHSMGGAIAVHVAASNALKVVAALCVIDVVEGSAMEALSKMRPFLNSRPQSFPSVEAAVKWCLQTKTAKNVKAARISMPSQIVQDKGAYRWRIDLARTEDYWVGWFKGLSRLFLSCPAPKLLVLAGVDRLDTELTVGQMQGKFQNTILPKVGHVVQEDSPDQLSNVISKFAIRFRICTPK
uniref:Protein phosphatase methylesterase 1 n=1 Tax=Syphacia muris TaxID=451379 RepID=A0A158R4K3_9BILA